MFRVGAKAAAAAAAASRAAAWRAGRPSNDIVRDSSRKITTPLSNLPERNKSRYRSRRTTTTLTKHPERSTLLWARIAVVLVGIGRQTRTMTWPHPLQENAEKLVPAAVANFLFAVYSAG